jgi:hypothetical protein
MNEKISIQELEEKFNILDGKFTEEIDWVCRGGLKSSK